VSNFRPKQANSDRLPVATAYLPYTYVNGQIRRTIGRHLPGYTDDKPWMKMTDLRHPPPTRMPLPAISNYPNNTGMPDDP
jgi:hypothetical protein